MDNKDTWLDISNFDVIILGTGFIESVLSGALSRIGKKVLHLDKNESYGGVFSTFNFEQINKFFTNLSQTALNGELSTEKTQLQYRSENGWLVLNIPKTETLPFVRNVVIWRRPENSTTTTTTTTTSSSSSMSLSTIVEQSPFQEFFPSKENRSYNIDLCSKCLWSNSPNVDLILRSGVGRYLEFKCLDKIYLWIQQSLQPVPCSKGEVFANKFLELSEKRQLMKFLQSLSSAEDLQLIKTQFQCVPFVEFLSQKLSDRLKQFLLYSVAMLKTDHPTSENGVSPLSTPEGLELLQRYLKSHGRYGGNTPLLYPLYGIAELCQAYCRLSAVYGGMFVLRRTAEKLLIETSSDSQQTHYKGIICSEGQTLHSTHLIAHLSHLPLYIDTTQQKLYSRCIGITDGPLTPEQLTLIVIPPHAFGNAYSVYLLQLSDSVRVTPSNRYLFQFITENNGSTAQQTLQTIVHYFFEVSQSSLSNTNQPTSLSSTEPGDTKKKPNLLWCCYYDQIHRKPLEKDIPQNVHLVGDPDSTIDLESALIEAERIYRKICPTEEFMPQVPNPEDVIFDDGDPETDEGESTQQQSLEPEKRNATDSKERLT